MKTGNFFYRDGANYKFTFSYPIPDTLELKIGEEIEYEQLGITRKEFHDDLIGYKYDKTSDHNIVEVTGIEED